jgi:hypothetical protein
LRLRVRVLVVCKIFSPKSKAEGVVLKVEK